MAISNRFLRAIYLSAGVFTIPMATACSPEVQASGPSIVLPGSEGGNAGSQDTTGIADGNAALGGSLAITGNGGKGGSGIAVVGAGGKCVDQDVRTARRTPVVMFVIDRSDSTKTQYGTASPDAGTVVTRWQALHDTIMDPTNGVIAKTQDKIYIGVTLYDGGPLPTLQCILDPASCPDVGACPRLITEPPAKNNFNKIAAIYNETNAGPGGTTPTAAALAEAYAQIEKQTTSVLDKAANPTPFVILVTDGEPNGCEYPPVSDYQGPEREVTTAAGKGIKTYVIGIDTSQSSGNNSSVIQTNLDNLAKLGKTGVTKAYTPTNKDQLAKTLTGLIGNASCEVTLNGKIAKGWEDQGTVLLNSVAIKYNDANGYKVTGDSTITLQGKACEQFSKDLTVILHADFPCEGFTLE